MSLRRALEDLAGRWEGSDNSYAEDLRELLADNPEPEFEEDA